MENLLPQTSRKTKSWKGNGSLFLPKLQHGIQALNLESTHHFGLVPSIFSGSHDFAPPNAMFLKGNSDGQKKSTERNAQRDGFGPEIKMYFNFKSG